MEQHDLHDENTDICVKATPAGLKRRHIKAPLPCP